MKKILSFYVAISFLFTGGNAHALIPLIPGVVPLLTYFGATTTLATALDYSLVLHAGILAIAFNKDNGAATSPTSSQLTVQLNPKNPLPTPAGWTSPTSGNIKPTPPSSTPADGRWTFDGQFFSDAESAAQAFVTAHYSQWTYQSYSISNTPIGRVVNAVVTCCGGGTSQNLGSIAVEDLSCPSGYTKSGTSCNLTNPAVVSEPSNNNCQIIRVGNTYSTNSNDPDCATNLPTMSGATVTPNTVSMSRGDGSVATVTINSDGTTTASESYPDIPNSKTHTLTTQYSAPDPSTGSVTLTGVSTASTPGVGITGSGTGNSNNGPTGDGQIVVDKLNAQDAAAAAAAAGNSQLPENPSKVSDLGLPQSNPYNSDFSGLSLPSSSGGCVNLEIDLPYLGHLSISPCQVVDAVAPMVNYLIISLGVIGGVAVWIRPSGGSA